MPDGGSVAPFQSGATAAPDPCSFPPSHSLLPRLPSAITAVLQRDMAASLIFTPGEDTEGERERKGGDRWRQKWLKRCTQDRGADVKELDGVIAVSTAKILLTNPPESWFLKLKITMSL